LIPHACHWGPFNAVVKDGVMIGVQPLTELDAMPTKMLTEGLLSRVYDKTRVKYLMVRKSYLENSTGDTKSHLRGKEPFVRASWDSDLEEARHEHPEWVARLGKEGCLDAALLPPPPVLLWILYFVFGHAIIVLGRFLLIFAFANAMLLTLF